MIKWFWFCLKVLLSFALIFFFIQKVDYHSVKNIIMTWDGIQALTFGVCVILLQNSIGGARLPYILRLSGYNVSIIYGIKTWLVGSFFTQTMISFVGGDAMRILYLRRASIPTKVAANAILFDRVIGFFALILLFLIFLPFSLEIIKSPMMRYGIYLLALSSVAGIIVFLLLGMVRFPQQKNKWIGLFIELSSNSRYLFISKKITLITFMLSLGVQLINIVAIYGIFQIYGQDISFFWCLALAIPAMLISMLPISVAGWGVRETAMIIGFSLLGLSTDVILAVSVTFGIAVCLAGLPGIWIFLWEQKRPMAPHLDPIKTTEDLALQSKS